MLSSKGDAKIVSVGSDYVSSETATVIYMGTIMTEPEKTAKDRTVMVKNLEIGKCPIDTIH